MDPTQTSPSGHPVGLGIRSRIVLAAALLSLICLLLAWGGADGAQGEDQAGAATRAAAPQVSNLRVSPRRVSGGRPTIRFTLDRGGRVGLVRLRNAGSETGEPFKWVRRGVAGEAGVNRLRVNARRLGYRRGQYLLRAQTLAGDGSTGDFAATNYRIVR